MAKTYTKTRVKAIEAMLLISKADRILAKDKAKWLCRVRRNDLSFHTIMWSRHSRRIEPTSRSTKGFCQGDRGAVSTSSIPYLGSW
jgi:hypothetical protein